jgi:hypothetical protein
VDGSGDVRPCHFVDMRLGNLYDGSFQQARRAMYCPATRCDCYIGYIHRTAVPALAPFAHGALERVWDSGSQPASDHAADPQASATHPLAP